jgi:hypothetical protein
LNAGDILDLRERKRKSEWREREREREMEIQKVSTFWSTLNKIFEQTISEAQWSSRSEAVFRVS